MSLFNYRLLSVICLALLFSSTNEAAAQRPDGERSPAAEQEGRGERGERGGRSGRSRTEPPPVLDAEFIATKLPAGVEYVSDVVFKIVDDLELKLDLLLPAGESKQPRPVAVWIHGGAWMRGNKARDLHRFDQLTSRILQDGIAFVSISYRLTSQGQFPDQIQDCNDALAFVHAHREKYNLDTSKMIILGTSAGGHLASLVGTSTPHHISDFFTTTSQPDWTIRGIVNFYGPADLLVMQGKRDAADAESDRSPEARLLGHAPLLRPDLARAASPTTYINKQSPPFLIFHGDQDSTVPITQSILLNAWLQTENVPSELVVVEGARHGDQKFDDTPYNDKAIEFIHNVLK